MVGLRNIVKQESKCNIEDLKQNINKIDRKEK